MENPTGKRLLLVDNNAEYRHSLRAFLKLENYQVEEAASVDEAIQYLERSHFDLLLVDLRMTDEDDGYDFSGMEVAKKARDTQTPCIVNTAYPTVYAARVALNSRSVEPLAVDFVEKGAGPQAILGAIQVVLGKSKGNLQSVEPDLYINLAQGLVLFKGKQIDLSKHQYDLLACLCQREGAVYSHRELIKAVYNEDISEEAAIVDRRLERLVERVRIKIQDDPAKPHTLVKVKGRGYRLILGGQESHRNTPV
jgi:DNA-binding response OmpR family regulator